MNKLTTLLTRRELLTLSGAAFGLGLAKVTSAQHLHSTKRIQTSESNKAMKKIGILGGLGPQATMDLEQRIHRISQQMITPDHNSGYPPMIVHFHRHAPVKLNDNGSPIFPFQPDARLLAAAKDLGAVSDFIIIPSNGVHMFQKDIEDASGKKVLSMIDLTIAEVINRKWKKVGTFGYKTPMAYSMKLKQLDIPFEVITEELQSRIDFSIDRVMEGRHDANDSRNAADIVQYFQSLNVDGIIPGCTELPFLLGDKMNDADVVNPVALLAQAAVEVAVGIRNV